MSRSPQFLPDNPQKIIERYLAGESPKQIGFDFGYSNGSSVLKFLRVAGVQIRSREENRALKGLKNG